MSDLKHLQESLSTQRLSGSEIANTQHAAPQTSANTVKPVVLSQSKQRHNYVSSLYMLECVQCSAREAKGVSSCIPGSCTLARPGNNLDVPSCTCRSCIDFVPPVGPLALMDGHHKRGPRGPRPANRRSNRPKHRGGYWSNKRRQWRKRQQVPLGGIAKRAAFDMFWTFMYQI